jgi:hypothetical protein
MTQTSRINSNILFTPLPNQQKGGGIHHREVLKKDICFKIFTIVTILLAAVAIIAGSLALMASKGTLPPSIYSLNKLSVIGEANSFVMLGGGIILFILGVLAWSLHLKKESQLRGTH